MNRSKINLALQTKISSFRYTFFELQIIVKNHHLTTFGLIASLMSSQKSAHFRVG